MRRKIGLFLLAAALLALPVAADLQEVSVGGSVRIRGNYISNTFNTFVGPSPGAQVRWAAPLVQKRAIGGPFNPNVVSIFDWDDAGKDVSFVEQRTRLHVNANFTDQVSAFVEFDAYGMWGEDFRSQNYIFGGDDRAATADDLEIFQAYVDVDEIYGYPVRMRVGRQELAFGSQFLVGTRDFAFFFTGVSFDALRLTYSGDTFTVDAWASKLQENFGNFGEGDIDFYGVYATCTAVENTTFDAYWLLLRDDNDIEDYAGGALLEWIEDLRGVDDYDTTMLHTVGLRAAGTLGAFDYDAEVAYQFGSADSIGTTFKPFTYGDDDADFDTFALKLDMGYTIEVFNHTPHLFAGFRYFGGEDNRDISFWDWVNPFHKPKASVSFNRLFSNQIASGFMDLNNDLSNAWLGQVGVEGAITEKLMGRFCVMYFEALETFDAPVHFTLGKTRVPVAPGLSWWTEGNDKDLGLETYLFMEYHYTPDLIFEFGWSHMFVGDGLKEGSYVRWNGNLFAGGTDDDDVDYVYSGCKIYF